MTAPALSSIHLAPEGQRLQLRVLLPPNLKAGRTTFPTKVEADIGGQIIPLEKLSPTEPYSMEPPHLLAALLLESWCQGKLASMLMLTPDQLRQLLQPLDGQPAVFLFNDPVSPLPWENGLLPAVHPHLEVPHQATAQADQPRPASKAGEGPAARRKAPHPAETNAACAMQVDGSTHFLAITLPSRENVYYADALDLVKAHSFRLEPSNRKWWLRDQHKTLQFLAEHWDDLEQKYRAIFSDNFKKRTQHIQRAKFAFKAREIADGYDLEVRLEAPGIPSEQFSHALARGQSYLQEGEALVLMESKKLAAFTEAVARLEGESSRTPRPRLRRRLSHAELAFASEVLEPLNLAEQAPGEWQRRSEALRDLSQLCPAPVEEALQAKLRPYQQRGIAWLWHLYRHQLGGILADEMGLGKTVQALALLSCIRAEAAAPCLVVCPASLVENWRREAASFTPWLSVQAHHGSGRDRSATALECRDLVITSYGTLAQDAHCFQQLRFACVIGDEAQHVKNRQTRNARALRGLNAQSRFLLTGTPVENSLADLRALFEFMLPGYLGKPLAVGTSREERELQNARLLQRAAPYILRRTKQAVAPELPEKIEQVVYCDMSQSQRAFYEEVAVTARRELFEMEMARAGEGRLRLAAFKELLRLRQACIDPRLIRPEAEIESAKLEAFREILEEALDGNHRILVFSQFTRALALLREELESRQVPHLYLDGSTRNRTALCQQFNDDAHIPVFLISLKAGGVGLNLTGADTVIHYDPWWNPAVEAQATDRAHRIGQTRVVTSYQLICPQTVEERVRTMQQSKAALLKGVFEASDIESARIGLADMKVLLEEDSPPQRR